MTAGHADESRTDPGRFGLLTKILVWRRSHKDAAQEGTQPSRAKESVPPPDGPTIAQWLWGTGFHIPGDAEHVLDLVTPFALNPAMSMLYLGAGLGGGARAIATKFATYVTGLESDDVLARRGMEMSALEGMQKRAPVTAYDPCALDLRPHSFDGILARHSTYTVAEKEPLLRALTAALKPRGHLLLTDYVLEPKAEAGPEFEAWQRQQRHPAHLWTAAQYAECLKRLGCEVRVSEDTTSKHRNRILAGWAKMISTADLRGLPKQHLLAVLNEAERWVRTVSAIDTGALRTCRIYGLAGAGGVCK